MGSIRLVLAFTVGVGLTLSGCLFGGGDSDDDDGGSDDPIPVLDVSGTVVDFETGDPIAMGVSVATDGLIPSPMVSVTGSSYTLTDVPPFSVFHVLAASLPSHRSTYGEPLTVEDVDVSGIESRTLSEDYIASLETEFGATVGSSILLARVVDENGDPVAGLAANVFQLNNAAPIAGPFFLDDNLAPDAALNATSASGYAVFFEVEEGLAVLSAVDGNNITFEMGPSPIAANAVSLARVSVVDGEVEPLPTGVSFRDSIVPIFENRGCDVCHSGGGIGRDLGGVTLDASANLIYRELTEELSPNGGVIRVNLETPEQSMLLTLPSPESPPDGHPNSTFASPSDPDYRLILGWITEGALDN